MISTGSVASRSRTPPPRKTRRKPNAAPARPPTTGPIAPPSATAEVTTPSAQPTRLRGVSTATRAVAAATVPLVAPWRSRRIRSSVGDRAKKMRPTVMAPPTIERSSIGLRPNLSPITPQIGLAIAIDRPDTLAIAAVQRSSSRPCGTPRSLEMKIDRKGNAKLKPKIAMNSANQSAARLRRQSIPPGPSGGLVVRGSVASVSAQQLDDAVGGDRQPVDDGARIAPAQRVFDGI